jgi:hypothetical protein
MKKTRREIVDFLENLVHKRESMESLNEKLSRFFGKKIEVCNVSQSREESEDDQDELTDWNLMFAFESEDDDDNPVDGDIYMLPMRREGFDGATMLITEVGYEFI